MTGLPWSARKISRPPQLNRGLLNLADQLLLEITLIKDEYWQGKGLKVL